MHVLTVVHQDYRTEVANEFVIMANSAIFKCTVPSFVADFVKLTGWTDETEGRDYFLSSNFGAYIFELFYYYTYE